MKNWPRIYDGAGGLKEIGEFVTVTTGKKSEVNRKMRDCGLFQSADDELMSSSWRPVLMAALSTPLTNRCWPVLPRSPKAPWWPWETFLVQSLLLCLCLWFRLRRSYINWFISLSYNLKKCFCKSIWKNIINIHIKYFINNTYLYIMQR